MRNIFTIGIGALVGIGSFVFTAPAHASACGTWQMSGSGRELVYGEAANADGSGKGYVAICEQPGSGGSQTYQELLDCKS